VHDAAVYYTERRTARDYFKQQYRYARAHPQLERKFRDSGFPRSPAYRTLLLPFVAAGGLLLGLVAPRHRRPAIRRLALFAGRTGGVLGALTGGLSSGR
jgi:hypothetical protein